MGMGEAWYVSWMLGQLSWETTHYLVLLTVVACTYAYGVWWNCEEGLAKGRMMRWVGVTSRVGLGGTESSGWQQWWSILQASVSPAGRLVGTAYNLFLFPL